MDSKRRRRKAVSSNSKEITRNPRLLNCCKDRKADKYMNQKVDLAEAAWAAKPSTYYAEMDQLIAQAREEEAKRQEEVEDVVPGEQEQQQQQQKAKYQQLTYHHSQNNNEVPTRDYIDEKFAHVEASMQEKLSQIEVTVNEKIAVALTQQQQQQPPQQHKSDHPTLAVPHHRRQCTTAYDCVNSMTGIVGGHVGAPLLYILLGILLLLFGWWKQSQVVVARKKTSVKNDTRIPKEKKTVNVEDGWEDVVVVSKSSSCNTGDLKEYS
jgi:hypothetical protein